MCTVCWIFLCMHEGMRHGLDLGDGSTKVLQYRTPDMRFFLSSYYAVSWFIRNDSGDAGITFCWRPLWVAIWLSSARQLVCSLNAM